MKKAFMMILFCLAMISFVFSRDIFEIARDGTPEEIKAAIEAGADVNAGRDGLCKTLQPAKQAQVKEFERRIDRMVYDLYGLTKEEIQIVEGE